MFFDLRSSQALFAAAEKLQLQPRWVTPYGLFVATRNNVALYFFASKTILNSQLASYLSTNKHATRVILEEHHLPNIPFCTPQSMEELETFFDQHHSIVCKPTLGQRAENVLLIKDKKELAKIQFEVNIFEKYIAGPEYRYLVLQGKVIAVHQKTKELFSPGELQRISFPAKEWDPQLVQYALHACKVIGDLRFAAVDFKVNAQGEAFILEVNSAPAIWRFGAPDKGPAVPVAELLVQATLESLHL